MRILPMKLPDARPCLGCGSQPRLTFNRDRKEYLVQCTGEGCLWSTGDTGFFNKTAALVRWHRDNKPKCELMWWHWCCRYAEMRGQVKPPMPESISRVAA